MSMLVKEEIKNLIINNDMISGYQNLDEQLQPNGFDLTLESLSKFCSHGVIKVTSKKLPDMIPIEPDILGNYILDSGIYSFTINETIKLPTNISALTIQRSTIMRSGCITNVGCWDSGYNGRGLSILNVINKNGLIIEKNSRLIQMIFFRNTTHTESYNGQYQHENLR